MTDEATPKTIGGRIRRRRLELGITMEELGESIGVTRQTVYKYESGIVKNIPLGVLISLTGTLGISADYLLGLTDESGQSIGDREGPGELTVIYADIESVRTAWDLGVPIEPRKRAVTLPLTSRQCDELAVRGHEEIVSAVVRVPVRGRGAPRIVLDPEEVTNYDLG